jgi:hypothetical protein
MSTALAIAGVTAVLRDLLNDGLVNHNVSGTLGSTVVVSVLPPDRVVPVNGTEGSQLNLFLHQVTPNLGWRNERLPSRDASGRQRLSNPPLALDLHYLLSAYTGGDLHAEILLGYAMQLLHETPVLTRGAIQTALNPSPGTGTSLPSALRALADSGLERQVEQIKVTPEYLSTEEVSKLWTAMQTHFRPTAAYMASVVLIEATQPARSALPVLSRGERDLATGRERGVMVRPELLPALPTIERVIPDGGQPVARLGESITLEGHRLAGTNREVLLANDRFGIDEALAVPDGDAEGTLAFTIPTPDAADFPVGVYRVAAQLVPAGETDRRETNRLAMTLAPHITGLPITVVRDGSGTAMFTVHFHPAIRAGQSATLLLGQQAYAPEPFTPPVTSLAFVIPDAPVGDHLARLRVDGIESPIIDRAATPPAFLPQRIDIQ